MTFVDLCSGIGGFRLGFERAGMKCIGYCEIDKYARKAYEAMFDTTGEWTANDITQLTEEEIKRLDGVDVVCGGFPCQPFSIAGRRKGFDDARGNIIFSISEFVRLLNPRWFVLENVPGILSLESGVAFRRILQTLSELGYSIEWAVLNSKDFGVPQNRERVYIIGHSGRERAKSLLPIGRADREAVAELQEITKGQSSGSRVYSIDGLACTLKSEGGGWGAKTGLYAIPKHQALCTIDGHGVDNQALRNINAEYAQAIVASYMKGCRSDGRNCVLEYTADNYRIRRLTPKECWRLQGFPDEMFEKAKAAGLSDTQLYKQAGNAVTVNVTEWIGKLLMERSKT